MFGGDVERIVAGIDATKNAAAAAIVALANATGYQLETYPDHKETEVPDGSPMSGVNGAFGSISGDVGKMNSIKSSLYTGYKSFNNSVGSPWDELDKLQQAINNGNAYEGAHAPFNYVGEKAGMLAELNMIMSAAVDAKWALVIYHDYIQRAYDYKYNGKEPSIVFDREIGGKKTLGNVDQEYEDNVHLPKQNNDPF